MKSTLVNHIVLSPLPDAFGAALHTGILLRGSIVLFGDPNIHSVYIHHRLRHFIAWKGDKRNMVYQVNTHKLFVPESQFMSVLHDLERGILSIDRMESSAMGSPFTSISKDSPPYGQPKAFGLKESQSQLQLH
jgi:hypothetical protein